MFKASKFYTHLSTAFEDGRNTIEKLDESDLQELTAELILTKPTKCLPKIDDYDTNREVIIMLAKWMKKPDACVAQEILEKMQEIAIQAFTPEIDDELKDYAKRDEIAQREAREHGSYLQYLDAKQRI